LRCRRVVVPGCPMFWRPPSAQEDAFLESFFAFQARLSQHVCADCPARFLASPLSVPARAPALARHLPTQTSKPRRQDRHRSRGFGAESLVFRVSSMWHSVNGTNEGSRVQGYMPGVKGLRFWVSCLLLLFLQWFSWMWLRRQSCCLLLAACCILE
jgi:hypothetical protein